MTMISSALVVGYNGAIQISSAISVMLYPKKVKFIILVFVTQSTALIRINLTSVIHKTVHQQVLAAQ